MSLNKFIDKKQQKLPETHFSKTLFSKVSPVSRIVQTAANKIVTNWYKGAKVPYLIQVVTTLPKLCTAWKSREGGRIEGSQLGGFL